MAKAQDSYSISYVLSGCTIVFSAVVLREYGEMGFYVLASFAGILWLAVAVIAIGINLARRRWRKSASILAAPLIVASVGLFAQWSGFSTDKARLFVWKSNYLADVAMLPEVPGGIRIKMWPWRSYAAGFSALSGEVSEVLVYDSSDQITSLHHFRSAEWFSAADRDGYDKSVYIHPELGEGGSRSRATEPSGIISQIGPHFFILRTEW